MTVERNYLFLRLEEILPKIKNMGFRWAINRAVKKSQDAWRSLGTAGVEFFRDLKRGGFGYAVSNYRIKAKFDYLINEAFYYATARKKSLYPLHTHIEVTSLCNLSCSMCPHSEMQRTQGTMEFETFLKIIDNLAAFRLPNTMFMHFTGEPLLNNNLAKMIKYAKEKGVPWIKFNTNAVFLNEENGRQIIDSGLDCIVCAVEMSEEEEAKLRPGADYKKVTENVRKFMQLKKKLKAQKPLLKLQMLVSKENSHRKKSAYRQWKNIVDVVDFHPLHTIGGLVKDLGCTKPIKSHCEPLWASLIFLWNGDVVPCCLNHDGSLKIGNILNEPLDKVWSSELLEDLRRDDRSGIYRNPICRRCMSEGVAY